MSDTAQGWLELADQGMPARVLGSGGLTVRGPVLTEDGMPGPLEVVREAPKSREELLLPLSSKERMLVVAMGMAIAAFSHRAELAGSNAFGVANVAAFEDSEKVALGGLMSAFRGATGVEFSEAAWAE